MLGERQKAAAAELAQWWDGLRLGGIGSHAVLLAGPAGWGRSTVLDQLPEIIRADAPIGLEVRINGRSLPDGPGLQAQVLRDSLLGPEVRQQAAALLCRRWLLGARRLGIGSLLLTGMAGTISLLLAGLAAAAAGGVADDCPASENGATARAARVVAAALQGLILDPYTTVDASVHRELVRGFTAFVAGENLGDVKYQVNQSGTGAATVLSYGMADMIWFGLMYDR